MEIIHLTYREGMSSVFMAQVVKPMSCLQQFGWVPTLYLFSPLGEFIRPVLRSIWHRRSYEIRDVSALRFVRFPSPPSRCRHLWPELPLLQRALRKRLGKNGKAIIHCRGYEAATLALDARRLLPGLKVLFDCRGLNGVEHAFVKGFPDVSIAPVDIANGARQIEELERLAAVGADAIVCVSEVMKNTICKRWSVPSRKISVVPCCTDVNDIKTVRKDREKRRSVLGISDRFVVAYCGSLESWQAPEQSLEWFKLVAKRNANAHFLAITTHADRMALYADHAGIPEANRTIVSVSQDAVIDHLIVADCGLLVRENSLVNEVASPVKFAEYLSAGVPVAISERVGDYSAVVDAEKIGVVLPWLSKDCAPNAVDDLLALVHNTGSETLAERCMTYAFRELSWKNVVGRVDQIYRTFEATSSGVSKQSRAVTRGGWI